MSPLAQILAQAYQKPPTPVPTTVQPTPVASIYANHDAQAMDAYKAQLAQQNAQFGGLASLGSAGILAGAKLFGGGGGSGAAAATSGGLSSLLPFGIL